MKKIYIMLSRTETSVANIIYRFTKGEFTHSSIALEPSTKKFHSFARLVKWTFLVAGYVEEDVHTFVFANYQNCRCAVFELEVSDESYEKMENTLKEIAENRRKYKYNLKGTITTALNIKTKTKNKFNCTQFVAMLLESSGAAVLPRDVSLMRPMDLLSVKGMREVYRGTIGECNFDSVLSKK